MSRSTEGFWRTRFLDFFHLCPGWQRFPDFQRRDPERVLRELMVEDEAFARLFLIMDSRGEPMLSREFLRLWLGFDAEFRRQFRDMIMGPVSPRRGWSRDRETLAGVVARVIVNQRHELFGTLAHGDWFLIRYWSAAVRAIEKALGAPPAPPVSLPAHLLADPASSPDHALIEAEEMSHERRVSALFNVVKPTKRQREVFLLLVDGHTPEQVAEQLGTTVGNVHKIRSDFLKKARTLGYRT